MGGRGWGIVQHHPLSPIPHPLSPIPYPLTNSLSTYDRIPPCR